MLPILLAIVGLFVVVLLFILLRKFFLWYWKINDIIALLEKQNSLLEEIKNKPRS